MSLGQQLFLARWKRDSFTVYLVHLACLVLDKCIQGRIFLRKLKPRCMSYQIIELIANISLALSFLIAAMFGIIEARRATRDRRERLTLEAIRNFQTREFAELTAQLTYHKGPNGLQEFKGLSLLEQTKYVQFSQEMESLGILVADRIIDIDLVDKTLGSFVTTSWRKYKTVIENIREKDSDPFLGEYFQWLAEYIEDRLDKGP